MVTLKDTASSISLSRNERFLKAQAVLKKLINIHIRKYHVNKIILIGSLADESRFGFHSDIDLYVEGLPDKLYFAALGELLMEAGEFDVDLITDNGVNSKMKERIREGRLLYEKR
jgi:predicted nucleotidyltransferase